jgi:hypothetical protein
MWNSRAKQRRKWGVLRSCNCFLHQTELSDTTLQPLPKHNRLIMAFPINNGLLLIVDQSSTEPKSKLARATQLFVIHSFCSSVHCSTIPIINKDDTVCSNPVRGLIYVRVSWLNDKVINLARRKSNPGRDARLVQTAALRPPLDVFLSPDK